MADKNYLCFEAVEDSGSTISFSCASTSGLPIIYYSLDDGTTWTMYTIGNNITLTKNQRCYWKGNNSKFCSASAEVNFSSTGNIKASGNIMSLLDESCQSVTIPTTYCFCWLFKDCISLLTPPELPATTLTNYCYYQIFRGCSNLISPPELPAITLETGCYFSMFYECSSLIEAPKLPATPYLAPNCYNCMFFGCSSLTKCPELPATSLIDGCYESMFRGCTSLVRPANLSADSFAYNSCCNSMFRECSNIKLSTTASADYTIPWQIECSGGAYASAFTNMFKDTGGTFTDTPTINTIYYLSVPAEYTITVNSSKGELDLSSTPSGYYEKGTEIKALVNPKLGYQFKDYLLKGYTRLEYIQSSLSQYIVTGYKPNYNTKIEIDFKAIDYNDNYVLWGSQNTVMPMLSGEIFKRGDFYLYASRAYISSGDYSYGDNFDLGDDTTSLERTVIQQFNTGALCLNRELGYQHYKDWPDTFSSIDYMTILGGCVGGANFKGSSVRLYNFKVTENDTLIHNYIPVIRHLDGAIGLLDLVELKFYDNSGLGEFIPGGIYYE